MTRRAISPRLAMRTFLNKRHRGRGSWVVGRESLVWALRSQVRDVRLETETQDPYGVRSKDRTAELSPVTSLNFRSELESTPDTRKANSFGLDE